MKEATSSKLNRRQALKAAAAGVAAAHFIPRRVLGMPGQVGANDRLRIGVIGFGSRVGHLLGLSTPLDQVDIVAAADCNRKAERGFQSRLALMFPETKPTGNFYQDYREMLDEEKLDGTFVTTPTHGRVLPCIHAMEAGVDIYAEKPATLTIEEGRLLVQAAQKNKSIYQVGTQARSIPLNRWAVEQLQKGAIGKIRKVICTNLDSPIDYVPTPAAPIPPELNWDMWCNQAPLFPFNPELIKKSHGWGPYREFDGGGGRYGITGFGTHAYDQIQWAINKDDTSPVEIWTEEPAGSNCPVHMRYADGMLLEMNSKPHAGPIFGGVFVGEEGKVEINRNVLRSNPLEIAAAAPTFDNPYAHRGAEKIDYDYTTIFHVANWLDCIRTRKQPNCPAEAAHRHSILSHLVNVARDLKRRLNFDPVSTSFVDDNEANRHASVTRPRRKGYELPELS